MDNFSKQGEMDNFSKQGSGANARQGRDEVEMGCAMIDFSKILKSDMDIDQNDPLMPQHPFRFLVVGGSGSGKTNMVLNLIMTFLKYDRLYLYARDIEEIKYRFLIKYFKNIQLLLRGKKKIEDNEQIFQYGSEYEDIISVDELDKKKQNLVIFDDFVTVKKHEKIEEYFIRGRKKNCSIIYITQSYTDVPKKIRLQCDYFAIYSIKSGNELINLRKEHGGSFPARTVNVKDEFKKYFYEATKGKFDFAMIDGRTSDDSLRFRKNFAVARSPREPHCSE